MSAFIRPKGPREAPYSLRTETTLKGINGISAMDNVRKLKKSVTKADTIERENPQENFNVLQYSNIVSNIQPIFKAHKKQYTVDELRPNCNMSEDEQYYYISKLANKVDIDSYKNYSREDLYKFIDILQNSLKMSLEWYKELSKNNSLIKGKISNINI